MDASYKAAILDLDGVITQTASEHAKAWKRMFDEYNETRKNKGEKPFTPFTIEKDYKQHLDGMPRYMGVVNFLSSRLIDLPHGDPSDKPGTSTVCGLGNLKNQYFQEIIKKEGVQVYDENVEKVREWKNEGLKTAIVSSSKNCKNILEAADLEHLFDTRVDGVVSEKLNLKGKPCADIFLEAVKRLNVKPEQAIIVEDSIAGVEAGKKGNFKLVIGIEHGGKYEELKRYGADMVVNNLSEVTLPTHSKKAPGELPSAHKQIGEILNKHKEDKLFLFFDFDGTLTPIVDNPESAKLSEDMFSLLFQLSQIYPTGVISGRDLRDISEKVRLEGLFYVGSHGFEIHGPNGFHHEHEKAREMHAVFDKVQAQIEKGLNEFPGTLLERKKYAIAVHYRQAEENEISDIRNFVNDIIAQFSGLKVDKGKKLIEIKPALQWDKGKAVEYLIDNIAEDKQNAHAIYLGDDLTDEDVFRTLNNGTGILVGNHGHQTYADYKLDNVKSVEIFLHQLLTKVKVLI